MANTFFRRSLSNTTLFIRILQLYGVGRSERGLTYRVEPEVFELYLEVLRRLTFFSERQKRSLLKFDQSVGHRYSIFPSGTRCLRTEYEVAKLRLIRDWEREMQTNFFPQDNPHRSEAQRVTCHHIIPLHARGGPGNAQWWNICPLRQDIHARVHAPDIDPFFYFGQN